MSYTAGKRYRKIEKYLSLKQFLYCNNFVAHLIQRVSNCNKPIHDTDRNETCRREYMYQKNYFGWTLFQPRFGVFLPHNEVVKLT